MSRASDLANLIASGNTTIFGEGGAPTANAGTASQTGGTTNLQQGLAKAWLRANGTGTVSITDSLNVSTFEDSATGVYKATFTNPMGNTTYTVIGTSGEGDKSQPRVVACGTSGDTGYLAASYGFVTMRIDNQALDDMDLTATCVHGDLA